MSAPARTTPIQGKIERYHRTLDKGTTHAVTPDGARATIAARIDQYSNRLHSAIGHVTRGDKLRRRHPPTAVADRLLKHAQTLASAAGYLVVGGAALIGGFTALSWWLSTV